MKKYTMSYKKFRSASNNIRNGITNIVIIL